MHLQFLRLINAFKTVFLYGYMAKAIVSLSSRVHLDMTLKADSHLNKLAANLPQTILKFGVKSNFRAST